MWCLTECYGYKIMVVETIYSMQIYMDKLEGGSNDTAH